MVCTNSSTIFVSDLPSYGLIGLIIIGLILYVSYVLCYIRNTHPSSSFYINLSQFSLFFVLISSMTFLFRPSASINLICSLQTLSLQIFPFFLLLGFNIHYIQQWLFQITKNSTKKTCLIGLSSFLIFLLAVLIQTSILLIWFYHQQPILNACKDECQRRLLLASLSLNFLLLFLFSIQSSIRYHSYSQRIDLICLLISLLALCVTMTWICLYLFTRLRSSWALYMNNNSILAYGNLFLVYTFLGPLLFEELFYAKKDHLGKSRKLTFKSLSLTKEQQRAFMAAYVKRNLTASCEKLTAISTSPPPPLSPTCHSTLSADSLCPTLPSTVSPKMNNDVSSCGTVTSEYLLLSTSVERK